MVYLEICTGSFSSYKYEKNVTRTSSAVDFPSQWRGSEVYWQGEGQGCQAQEAYREV